MICKILYGILSLKSPAAPKLDIKKGKRKKIESWVVSSQRAYSPILYGHHDAGSMLPPVPALGSFTRSTIPISDRTSGRSVSFSYRFYNSALDRHSLANSESILPPSERSRRLISWR